MALPAMARVKILLSRRFVDYDGYKCPAKRNILYGSIVVQRNVKSPAQGENDLKRPSESTPA